MSMLQMDDQGLVNTDPRFIATSNPHQQRAHRRSRPDFLTHSSAGDLCDSLLNMLLHID